MVSQTGSQSKREKAAKGSVQVKAVKGRLRLVWSFQEQRYFLSLETEDSALSRKVAEAKAKLIETDVLTGNFDPSLDKYKPETQRKSSILVPDLMDSFLKQKAKQVSKRTMEKCRAFGTHPQRFFKNKAAVEVEEPQADKFRVDLLSRELDPATIKAILGFCGSCWE
jgi:integrase